MANTFKYQTIWTKEFQKSNWALPVYPVIADLQFSADLQKGDTVKRRYRNNYIVAKDLGSDGAYVVQNYSENEDTFSITKQKEASVRIVKTEVLHTDLNSTESYGKQLSNAIYQEIDGDTLNAARAGAASAIDAGSFGGTSGEGLTVSIANIADVPIIANEIFLGSNVVVNDNARFGKLAYEYMGGMKTWIVPPQVWTQIQKYMIARNTNIGDKVTVNGYQGRFGDYEVFLSNNLPWTARLTLGANPTDGDTFTIKGVTFRFKDTLAANGDILIGESAAVTADNVVAALNALTTAGSHFDPFVDGTDTLTENGLTINKSHNGALHGISAVDGTSYVTVTMKGTGKVTVSSSFVSNSNLWTAAYQQVHSLFMIAKNVSLAIRSNPQIYENSVSNSVARDYVMWTVYDNKVFADQARAIIDFKVRCDASSFTAYSNVHA